MEKNNIDKLKIISYMLQNIVNDIDCINAESIEIAQDYMIDYDLGNNTYIKREDLESIVSIIDTINDIISYNKEV